MAVVHLSGRTVSSSRVALARATATLLALPTSSCLWSLHHGLSLPTALATTQTGEKKIVFSAASKNARPSFYLSEKNNLFDPMKTHPIPKHSFASKLILGVLLGNLGIHTAQAAISISANVGFSPGTAIYTYSYSITSTGTVDTILVTVPLSPAANVLSISAPAGFALTFDPVAAVLSFIEDNDLFTEQTFGNTPNVTPFTFTSPLAPMSVTFTAFDVSGTEFNGTTLAPVPEPTTTLLCTSALGLAVLRRRRLA